MADEKMGANEDHGEWSVINNKRGGRNVKHGNGSSGRVFDGVR